MNEDRLRNLTFLAFEKKRVANKSIIINRMVYLTTLFTNTAHFFITPYKIVNHRTKVGY